MLKMASTRYKINDDDDFVDDATKEVQQKELSRLKEFDVCEVVPSEQV